MEPVAALVVAVGFAVDDVPPHAATETSKTAAASARRTTLDVGPARPPDALAGVCITPLSTERPGNNPPSVVVS